MIGHPRPTTIRPSRLATLWIVCAAACSCVVITSALPREAPAEERECHERALSALLKRFADLPGLEARFREEKRIALLQAPLESEGTIRFAPPGLLHRHLSSPSPSTMLIDGDQLRFHDGRQTQSIDLDSNPMVQQFVSGFVSLLAGDEAALRRLYDLCLTTSEDDGWTLVLTPRSESMRRALREVRFSGEGVVVRRMHLFEASGDETILTFHDVDATRTFTDAERTSLFRLP